MVLDIVWKCDIDNKVDYVWHDTGLEYQATKDHLKKLEEEYSITINRYKATKPIPVCCSQYGQPFLSKQVSEYLINLQRHEFNFEDDDFDTLYAKYPKCKSALQWWCNVKPVYKISNNAYLKEYMSENHPAFKISNRCCEYAKKRVLHKILVDNKYDLLIHGIRKYEGLLRATMYKGCFDEHDVCDRYRPLFWYTNSDKKDYEESYGITHSKCYTEYGLKRTGCACCPFGRNFEQELAVAMEYEPKLYKAASSIFRDSIDYTRGYKEFCSKRKGEISWMNGR